MSNVRQQLINKFKEKAALILVTNGYDTDIGQNVAEWLEYVDPETAGINIRDLNDEIIGNFDSAHQLHKLTVEFEISGYGSATVAGLRSAMNDVLKMIGANLQWDDLAVNTYPLEANLEKEQQERILGQSKVVVEVHYRTVGWGA